MLENTDFDETPDSWCDMDDEYIAQDRENAEMWEKFFKLWDEWREVSAAPYLNANDKEIVKNEIVNNQLLLKYFEKGDFASIIKKIREDIEDMQWRRYVKKHQGEWEKMRDYERDTLY